MQRGHAELEPLRMSFAEMGVDDLSLSQYLRKIEEKGV